MSETMCFRWHPDTGDIPLDCTLLADARLAPEIEARLDRPEALARLIEGEILPRLMLVHSEPRPAGPPPGRRPSPEEVERFAALLLTPGSGLAAGEDVRPLVSELLAGGLPLESLLVDLLTPAARHLGRLWEEDACDFLAVTTGLGRLQIITRMLCAQLEGEPPPRGRSALLLPCPGETHVFSLTIVASAFREAGWTVEVRDEAAGVAAIGRDFYDVAGLTLACDVNLPALPGAIAALREASCNPNLRVVVGGAYFARHPDQAAAVGADAWVGDARAAPTLVESLLELRARAC